MFGLVKKHKVVSVLVLANLVAAIVVATVVVLESAKTATVDVYVAPGDAAIELNGEVYENFNSYEIVSGEYTVSIKKEGMSAKEYNLKIEDGEFARIRTYLTDADGGFSHYLNHADDAALLGELAEDKAAREFVARYDKLSGIVGVLPLEYYERGDGVAVGVYIDQDEGVCEGFVDCLAVYGGERNRETVRRLVREAGYNPDDYKMVFVKEGE